MKNAGEQLRDELLVMRCQDGDAAAFDKLVGRWHPRLWRHARRLTGRDEAAWDVAQEAWLAIVRGLWRLDDPARFRPWAYRIVTHKAADWVRRRSRQRPAERVDEGLPAPPAEPHSPGDAAAGAVAALGRLDPPHRIVLTLHYLDGLGVADIAAVLGIPAGTVKSRLHHGRMALRRKLELTQERGSAGGER